MSATIGRRQMLAASAAVAVGAAWSATRSLPAARSLAAEIAAARSQGKPLVLMVSLDHCPFCREARENYLVPLHESGQPVVQVDIGHPEPLIDAQGRASTHADVVKALRVRVAPTVLFLGPGGKELAPRLAGMPADFYAAYLQDRLDTATRALG